jgi:hypothetical protein
MTNDGQPVIGVKKFSPELRERFTQQDRDEADQGLQEVFANERIRRELSSRMLADTSASSVSGPPPIVIRMRKAPAPSEWNVVNVALGGALFGMVAGALFCCVQMATSGADFHLVRDATVGAAIGVLVPGTVALIRNRIARA